MRGSGGGRRGSRCRRDEACRRVCRTSRRTPGVALFQRREDRAPVVVDHHDGQVGSGLVGPDESGRSNRAGTSRRPSGPDCETPHDRPRAAPIVAETVPSMPARPRLAMTLRRSPTKVRRHASWSRSRIGVRGTDVQHASGGYGGAHRTGDLLWRQARLGGEQLVEPS